MPPVVAGVGAKGGGQRREVAPVRLKAKAWQIKLVSSLHYCNKLLKNQAGRINALI